MQRIIIVGLAILSGAAMMFWLFAFKLYNIPTGSMTPTIRVGDRVVMSRLGDDIQRGDVVAFPYPLNPKADMMKRIVGLPCDTVEIRDKQLFVNGIQAQEPYVLHDDPKTYPVRPSLPEPYRSRDQFGPYTIPAGQYFVLGDNRDKSADSRYWGPIAANSVRGRIVLVIGNHGIHQLPRPPVLASLPACRSNSSAPPATPATPPAR